MWWVLKAWAMQEGVDSSLVSNMATGAPWAEPTPEPSHISVKSGFLFPGHVETQVRGKE